MFVFSEETMIKALEKEQGVDLVSYGKPRDAFRLMIDVPHWTSGFGGKYEMIHSNVPMGAMIAVGNAEDLDLSNQTKLKQQLKEIDIYPTGHSGDFSAVKVDFLNNWFAARSILDNEVNSQTAIAHLKELTPRGIGKERYNDLVNYLADSANMFKDPGGNFIPEDLGQRKQIAGYILKGLSETVRYTRLDEPAKAYQITGQISIEKGSDSAISLNMREASKILVLRTHKNGLKELTPLDRAMIGKTYVTKDGEPLGDRGQVDLSAIAVKAQEIESNAQPGFPTPSWLRFPTRVVNL